MRLPRPRTLVLIAAIAVVALLAAVSLLQLRERPAVPELLDAQALAALPDAQLEQRVVNDLAQRLAYDGFTPGAWHRLGEAARAVWAASAVEQEALDYGFARLAAAPTGDDQAPGLADARDAYRTMGLTAAADALDAAIAGNGERARPAFAAAVRDPAARATRAAFLRSHLAELATP